MTHIYYSYIMTHNERQPKERAKMKILKFVFVHSF